MKRKAFTLAEVLITLVVIGIVAAITIPIVITNQQEVEKEAIAEIMSKITPEINPG